MCVDLNLNDNIRESYNRNTCHFDMFLLIKNIKNNSVLNKVDITHLIK